MPLADVRWGRGSVVWVVLLGVTFLGVAAAAYTLHQWLEHRKDEDAWEVFRRVWEEWP